jgi:hypothetical protein
MKSLVVTLIVASQCLCLLATPLAADDCEILNALFYERKQGEIVTDWNAGIPYRRYQSVVYPCAYITIRDNAGSISQKEVEFLATFTDQSTASKKAWCDRKRLEGGDEYSCTVCFESDSPIADLKCIFK